MSISVHFMIPEKVTKVTLGTQNPINFSYIGILEKNTEFGVTSVTNVTGDSDEPFQRELQFMLEDYTKQEPSQDFPESTYDVFLQDLRGILVITRSIDRLHLRLKPVDKVNNF